MYKTIAPLTALVIAATPFRGNAQQGTSQNPDSVDPGKRCEALYRAPGHDSTKLPNAPECDGLRAVIDVLSSNTVVEEASLQSEVDLQSYCGTLQAMRNTFGGDNSPQARVNFNKLRARYDTERQKQVEIFTTQEQDLKRLLEELEKEVPYIASVAEYQRAKAEVRQKFTVARDHIRAADCLLLPLPPLPPELSPQLP